MVGLKKSSLAGFKLDDKCVKYFELDSYKHIKMLVPFNPLGTCGHKEGRKKEVQIISVRSCF